MIEDMKMWKEISRLGIEDIMGRLIEIEAETSRLRIEDIIWMLSETEAEGK